MPAAAVPGALSPSTTCSFYRDADGHLWQNLTVADLPTALRQCGDSGGETDQGRTGQLWVDIDSTDPAQHALLRDVFRFHPLAVEDTLSADSRVRVEQYEEDYLFAIVRGVAFHAATPDSYDLETQNLYFFIGLDYLVTVHAGPAPAVGGVRAHIERNPRLMARGVARLAHLALDSYLTQVSNRTGQATKGLSVVATLSVAFVVVAGMWGMNFERVPFAKHGTASGPGAMRAPCSSVRSSRPACAPSRACCASSGSRASAASVATTGC